MTCYSLSLPTKLNTPRRVKDKTLEQQGEASFFTEELYWLSVITESMKIEFFRVQGQKGTHSAGEVLVATDLGA